MNIKSIITAAMALLVSTACSGGAKQEKVMKTEGKSIVVFFSHAGDNYSVGNIEVGNTKIVADYITELTGADQFEIVTHKYDGMAYKPLCDLAKPRRSRRMVNCLRSRAPLKTSASTTPCSSAAPYGGEPIRR